MGRHTRDEEPVPHPLDRTPRVPAEGRPATAGRPHPGQAPAAGRGEASGSYPVVGRGETSGSYPVVGRSEASGAFRTPGRSSISAAFGIAGRVTGASRASGRGESTGSFFVSETPPAAPGRGEASGFHPATGRSEATAGLPAERRGEASGFHPGETTGAQPTGRRGETSGAYPAVRSETTAVHPVERRAETPGETTGRRGGTTGRRGKASGGRPAAARPAETAAERTEVITRHEEASGDYPITAWSEASGSFRAAGQSDAPARPGSRRAARRGEATELDTIGESEHTGSRRSRRRGETPGADETARPAPGRSETTGPHRTATGQSETTGSHRTLGKGGEVTGSHRIVGKKAPRRRIATWPIACAVLAALIGLGIIGWNWADSELNSRAEAQAASCSGGTSQMRIVVTPSVQKPLTAAADRWNQAATVVHGQCVHVTIDPKPSAQVLDALVGRANLDSIGGLPAAWLPESSYWVSELTTKKPEMIGSPAQSVANARSADYPFIGLTGQGIDDTVLRAAQTFREYLEQPAQQADFVAAGIKTA
ncbi:hypothetical protein [Amycolatopsis sp. cmx-4-68]|uniref:hypothetical protein n=1 Tax=Amycolatopsis sp. cmx-4-68 TaxID=2790938 RepID=UPI00397CE774